MIEGLLHLVFDLIVPFFAGMTPDRPLWLRRLVQALLMLVLMFVSAAVYGLYGLIGALT